MQAIVPTSGPSRMPRVSSVTACGARQQNPKRARVQCTKTSLYKSYVGRHVSMDGGTELHMVVASQSKRMKLADRYWSVRGVTSSHLYTAALALSNLAQQCTAAPAVSTADARGPMPGRSPDCPSCCNKITKGKLIGRDTYHMTYEIHGKLEETGKLSSPEDLGRQVSMIMTDMGINIIKSTSTSTLNNIY